MRTDAQKGALNLVVEGRNTGNPVQAEGRQTLGLGAGFTPALLGLAPLMDQGEFFPLPFALVSNSPKSQTVAFDLRTTVAPTQGQLSWPRPLGSRRDAFAPCVK